MNSQSRGEVKLASANPAEPPVIDPGYLTHPYDVVILRDAIKEALKLMETPTMSNYYRKPILAPKSASDEDVVVRELRESVL